MRGLLFPHLQPVTQLRQTPSTPAFKEKGISFQDLLSASVCNPLADPNCSLGMHEDRQAQK
jgi:hypothetical protein